MVEMAKMSSKGQVVIPARIRDELKLEDGSRFVVDRTGSAIIFKRINVSDALDGFDELVRRGTEITKRKGIKSEEDFARIVHERRKRGRV